MKTNHWYIFRNNVTGETFNSVEKLWNDFTRGGTCKGMSCKDCPICRAKTGYRTCCYDFVHKFPELSAQMMGYSVKKYGKKLTRSESWGDYFRVVDDRSKAKILSGWFATIAESELISQAKLSAITSLLESPCGSFVSAFIPVYRQSERAKCFGKNKHSTSWGEALSYLDNDALASVLVQMSDQIGPTFLQLSKRKRREAIEMWASSPVKIPEIISNPMVDPGRLVTVVQ